ncbi:MAG: indole-3-glycerol phosphate synthase TrpC [Candidatus Gracilibacteria bacterium]|nr:indole-3-glycerol phosphate synthase TrpC [Candidatus Gracilibacteria bacterium]MDD5179127.1 indole-3-glycerol phosphate synthase TrpC [Candidatus Gracilibacteria bacterium]
MFDLLDRIVAQKLQEIAKAKSVVSEESLRIGLQPSKRSFATGLRGGRNGFPKLIAEFKRKSPSQNSLRSETSPAEIVKLYNKYAAAISILTDEKFFGGNLVDLEEASKVSVIPLLRKDFILDTYQLLEARKSGAAAALLIAAILSQEKLIHLLAEAEKIGLDTLVEIHTEEELERVLQTEAKIIGINNRNLDTLEIDLQTSLTLAAKIPAEKIIVAESGINSREDVEKLIGKVDAILVGSSILKSENPETKLRELTIT